MEGVKDELLSQKNTSRGQSEMPAPPNPTNSAPRASSPKESAVEVQVKASQPSREATPPTSDALSPPSAQAPNGEDVDDDETDQDPAQEVEEDETLHELQPFDWSKLEEEYEAAMAHCDEKEEEATEEFRRLANYFSQWSDVSHSEDRERSAKRYKTREAHIMHSESEYQKKKEHFDKVVEAFKSAMELLRYT